MNRLTGERPRHRVGTGRYAYSSRVGAAVQQVKHGDGEHGAGVHGRRSEDDSHEQRRGEVERPEPRGPEAAAPEHRALQVARRRVGAPSALIRKLACT